MGVDVVHFAGRDAGVFQRQGHTARRAISFRRRRGDMIRVAIGAVADNFRVDFCAALERPLPLFEDQDARSFADDEPVAILVEGPAGAFRIVVARRKRFHGGKATDA